MNTFVKIFAKEGVHISEAEARGPMGIHKRVRDCLQITYSLKPVHGFSMKCRQLNYS